MANLLDKKCNKEEKALQYVFDYFASNFLLLSSFFFIFAKNES
jgi:hypothetical protein